MYFKSHAVVRPEQSKQNLMLTVLPVVLLVQILHSHGWVGSRKFETYENLLKFIYTIFSSSISPTPVAHITQCILQQAPSNQNKKEQGRERSKSIRIKLTKASKLFQRKSTVKPEPDTSVDFYTNDFVGGSLSDDLDLYSKTPSGKLLRKFHGFLHIK